MAASLSFLSPSAGGDDVALPSRPNTTTSATACRRRRRRRRHYVASLKLEHAVHAKHLHSEDIFKRRRRHDRSRPLPSSMGQSGRGRSACRWCKAVVEIVRTATLLPLLYKSLHTSTTGESRKQGGPSRPILPRFAIILTNGLQKTLMMVAMGFHQHNTVAVAAAAATFAAGIEVFRGG